MATQFETDSADLSALKADILRWGKELGFQQIGISDIDLAEAEVRLGEWLQDNFHGDMDYMHRHGSKRSRPEKLVPGTIRVISARMDYLPQDQEKAERLLDHDSRAYVSLYALGRDYHKVLRGRLRDLARQICSDLRVEIISGVVSSDHVHMLMSMPPNVSVSKLMQRLKGKTSYKLQRDFQE